MPFWPISNCMEITYIFPFFSFLSSVFSNTFWINEQECQLISTRQNQFLNILKYFSSFGYTFYLFFYFFFLILFLAGLGFSGIRVDVSQITELVSNSCDKTFLILDYNNDNYSYALTFPVLITTYLLLHSSIFHFVRLSSFRHNRHISKLCKT